MEEKLEGMLSPYRVLDLSGESGLLCGKLLGDLGADVIKIERPGGDPARNIGPFFHDETHSEKSLFWFALNTNKRGITLDIEKADGQAIFKRLVKSADFIIESFSPGYMDKLGFGHSVLERFYPRIIMISISPFGQTGPYRDFKASDIVAWAMGGMMYPFGDTDRPPYRISHHSQSYLIAGTEAATGAMMALYYRQRTGKGQHVDVSIQECVTRCTTLVVTPSWDMLKTVPPRGDIRPESMWLCKDGYVFFWLPAGAQGRIGMPAFVKWLEGENIADDYLRSIDWDRFDAQSTTKEVLDRISEPIRRYFAEHSKAEILQKAVEYRVMVYPVSTTRDMLESVQLEARGFWTDVEHPELKTSIRYPGAFTKASEVSDHILFRAPLIGEHNEELYKGELGFSNDELQTLERTGVI